MSSPEDQIAAPARGRFFAFSFPEILGMVREYNFQSGRYWERIDICFVNLTTNRLDQIPIASFCPQNVLILYSFPKTFSPVRARLIVKTALREFATLDKSAEPSGRYYGKGHFESTSFIAYLEKFNHLAIVKRHRFGTTEKKFRGDDKLSSAHILKNPSLVEKQLYTLHVTASNNE